MPSRLSDPLIAHTISRAQSAARSGLTQTVTLRGTGVPVAAPFPSPADWRDHWIYFVLIDRFNNEQAPPKGDWNQRFDFRQGGTFKGIELRLDYLHALGARAIWLSPVLRNPAIAGRRYDYHGYAAQDFLNVDERLGSDGTRATAERELEELVRQAHARGMHVILDVVLNHTARVFDYVRGANVVSSFTDADVMNGPLGSEPAVRWLDGSGEPRADFEDRLPQSAQLEPDDAVWPEELQQHVLFRRRGATLGHTPGAEGFVRGDFGDLRQLVVEYDASQPGQEELRRQFGVSPVLAMLIRAHQYLIARYDFDGFRIDTVKYVDPRAIETFGNAMREFGLSVGKKNFFTFGEVYDDETTIARFTGRNGGGEGFGIDAALDFPLFFKLPQIAKGFADVAELRGVYDRRKQNEAELLSSHGEAGRFFVSFLDNHDQHQRVQHPDTPRDQVTLALALLFTLQGIPSLYYGTEQGLAGTVDAAGNPDLAANESTREALWGKPQAFRTDAPAFAEIRRLSELREAEPALRYGRLYFRELSLAGRQDFGHSFGAGGIVAFSRILVDREVLVVANTGSAPFAGRVILDRDLNAIPRKFHVAYSNVGTSSTQVVQQLPAARFWRDGEASTGPAAALDVELAPGEVQVHAPE